MDTAYLLLGIAAIISLTYAQYCEDCFQKVIYVDSKNGTPDSACWTGEEKQPCGSLELALQGAQLLNTAVAIPAGLNEDINLSSTTDYTNITTDSIIAENSTCCPPWYFYNDSAGGCECGSHLGGLVVHCDPNMNYTLILQSYCMTYDNDTGVTVAGPCLYNFFNISKTRPYLSNYLKLPKNANDFNDWMCGGFNRRGQLCGQCIEQHDLPTYSYDLKCRNCTYSRYNWVKYTAAAFGPLTLFLFIVLFFRISVTSPPLVAFVTVSQFNSAPVLIRLLLLVTDDDATVNTIVRVTSSLKGVWNLDFFRTLLPPICLQLTTLQALALDYFVAFYPMLLILIIYFLNHLYERNNRLLRWLWSPFYVCCVRLRRRCDVKTTLIDAFATFLMLSITKFLNVSFDILAPTRLYYVHGNESHAYYLYYNATVQYFSQEHLPYAIAACLILLIVVILPFSLLLLYQCACFQKCLLRFRLRSNALHSFMDAFQGCLKNGTNGTRDCRYFAAIHLGVGLLLYILYARIHNFYLWPLLAITFILISVCYNVLQPYRLVTYNTVASCMFLLLAVSSTLVMGLFTASTNAPGYLHLTLILIAVADTLPQWYITGVFIHWFACKKKVPQVVLQKLRIWKARSRRHMDIDFQEMLPDRISNPDEYQSLLT